MASFILGIDTSCDETSAAILEDGRLVRSNIISSQIALHAPHGGVVPELASRSHVTALPVVVHEALKKAGITLKDLSGVAITTTPGLIGCLLVGLSYAKALACSLQIPVTAVHHLRGHLFSPFLEAEERYPFFGLVVSGGHTALYRVNAFDDISLLGQTVDDAAGEAFDKVARVLGLGYPGGPVVDKLAQLGDPKRFNFTLPQVKGRPFHVSYSGLKTAVAQLVREERRRRKMTEEEVFLPEDPFVRDVCAAFQCTAVEMLCARVRLAVAEFGINCVAVSGGVAVNSGLRAELKSFANVEVLLPRPSYCTDNGAMIAYVGAKQIQLGRIMALDQSAHASLPL